MSGTAKVKILPPERLCEHFTQLGDLIHWQSTMNLGSGNLSVIPTLDKGRGRNRKQAVILYCPLCGRQTFEVMEEVPA